MDNNATIPAANPPVTTDAAEPFKAPEAVGAPAPAKPSVEQLVEDWFARHFHGMEARFDDFYNHLHHAKEDLQARLRALGL